MGYNGNMGFIRSLITHNPLFFSFFLPLAADTTLTLVGQDASYWNDFSTANEAAPIRFLLTTHPAVFVGASLLWYVFLYWLVQKVRKPVNLMVALSLMVGHSVGSESWIVKILLSQTAITQMGRNTALTMIWSTTVGYFLLVGILGGLALSAYLRQRMVSHTTNS